jgi:hypothetical protein
MKDCASSHRLGIGAGRIHGLPGASRGGITKALASEICHVV